MQWNYSSAWYPTEGDGLLFGAVTLYKLVQRQVRADATNAFNHPSFGPPKSDINYREYAQSFRHHDLCWNRNEYLSSDCW